jgi:hypothetical protein
MVDNALTVGDSRIFMSYTFSDSMGVMVMTGIGRVYTIHHTNFIGTRFEIEISETCTVIE